MLNIAFMANKAKVNQLLFRPHFKTHQSYIIGEWFKIHGVRSITVSSVSMAQHFAGYGWKDITIAFPVNIPEIDKINTLAGKIKLNLIADNIFSLKELQNKLTFEVGIFLKIDTGYHRSGIDWDDDMLIIKNINFLSKTSFLRFRGFLTHSGHAYNAKSIDDIKAIHKDTLCKMGILINKYSEKNPSLLISIGDTPCCSICNDFTGIDELRPGNFVFYDVMQYYLGSCTTSQIAVSVACPIVSISKSRKEFVIYGGAIHLSKEFITDRNKSKIFGLVVEYNEHGWSEPIVETYVSAISQEHGIIKTNANFIKTLKPGSIVGILPIHSCLAAHQLQTYHTIGGDEITL